MSIEKNDKNASAEPKPVPSPGPLKNEPTPERAAEEKKRQEANAETARPKTSGAV